VQHDFDTNYCRHSVAAARCGAGRRSASRLVRREGGDAVVLHVVQHRRHIRGHVNVRGRTAFDEFVLQQFVVLWSFPFIFYQTETPMERKHVLKAAAQGLQKYRDPATGRLCLSLASLRLARETFPSVWPPKTERISFVSLKTKYKYTPFAM